MAEFNDPNKNKPGESTVSATLDALRKNAASLFKKPEMTPMPAKPEQRPTDKLQALADKQPKMSTPIQPITPQKDLAGVIPKAQVPPSVTSPEFANKDMAGTQFWKSYQDMQKKGDADTVTRIEADPKFLQYFKMYDPQADTMGLAEDIHTNAKVTKANLTPDPRSENTAQKFYNDILSKAGEPTIDVRTSPTFVERLAGATPQTVTMPQSDAQTLNTAETAIPLPVEAPPVTSNDYKAPQAAPTPAAPAAAKPAAAPAAKPAEAPKAAAAEKKPDTEYKVKFCDNMWDIAKKHYGLTKNEDIAKAVETMAQNNNKAKGTDANNLKVGESLKLPADWKPAPGQKGLDWNALDAQTKSRQGQGQAQGNDRAYNPDTDGPLKNGGRMDANGGYYPPGYQAPQQQQAPRAQTADDFRRNQDLYRDPLNEKGFNRNRDTYSLNQQRQGISVERNSRNGGYQTADTNGDGRISRTERMDRNGDGRTSRNEFYDRDGNGSLSRKEQQTMQRDFDRAARGQTTSYERAAEKEYRQQMAEDRRLSGGSGTFGRAARGMDLDNGRTPDFNPNSVGRSVNTGMNMIDRLTR